MAKHLRRASQKRGLPPGKLVYVGKPSRKPSTIDLIQCSKTKFSERVLKSSKGLKKYKRAPTSWIDVVGVQDAELIKSIGEQFKLHPLLLEDVMNTDSRPKVEIFDDYVFLVLKMFLYDAKKHKVDVDQVSLVLGKNYVISFQQTRKDDFENVRERLRQGRMRQKEMPADFLVYSLIDAVVDHYFVVLEEVGEDIEVLEAAVVKDPNPEILVQIRGLKRELLTLRKSVWPMREAINSLMRGESKLITKKTLPYLRDVYDHTITIIDTIETQRDMVTGMLDIYLSSVSNRMNEVMKVLTVVGSIFIPLTFLTGVYGMNFRYMPELYLEWTYPAIWAIFILVGLAQAVYFKRKGWW